MQFDYFYIQQANGSLEIDDIGNCALIVTNDLYREYILIIKTSMGKTEVLQYGPNKIDFEELPERVDCSYQRFDYNQNKIKSVIDKFLNDPKKIITQAIVVSVETAKEHIRDFTDFV